MEQYQDYVLFPNHDNGIHLYQELKKLGVRAQIAPTPRAASKCCGISLMIRSEDIEIVKKCINDRHIEILDIVRLKKNIDPARDRYC